MICNINTRQEKAWIQTFFLLWIQQEAVGPEQRKEQESRAVSPTRTCTFSTGSTNSTAGPIETEKKSERERGRRREDEADIWKSLDFDYTLPQLQFGFKLKRNDSCVFWQGRATKKGSPQQLFTVTHRFLMGTNFSEVLISGNTYYIRTRGGESHPNTFFVCARSFNKCTGWRRIWYKYHRLYDHYSLR